MIVGIGGVSNSGKSNLAKKIKDHYHTQKITILCQDDFTYPVDQLPKIKGHIDWETPETINFEEFKRAVLRAKSDADIVIAEGLFAFYDEQITELYDKKLFIEISYETFLARKKLDFRWGKEPSWYIDHIWNSYLKYGRPVHLTPDYIIIDGEKSVDVDQIIF